MTFREQLVDLRDHAELLAAEPVREEAAIPLGPAELYTVARFATDCFALNQQYRAIIRNDTALPAAVREDPPSLRSTMWMVLVDEALTEEPGVRFPRPLEQYPLRLYALTRCYFNGADDVMDQSSPPFGKHQLEANPTLRSITAALGQEFLRLERQGGESHRAQDSLRFFRMARDLWIDHFNISEMDRSTLTFADALKYAVNVNGPVADVILHTVSATRPVSERRKQEVSQAFTWYAAAGKLIDDITDWLKDWRNQEVNLLTLALKESGELDTVVRATRVFEAMGPHAFVPVTLFRTLAPEGTRRVLGVVDHYINRVCAAPLPRTFGLSLRGVRHAMWAYALNEGTAQV